MRTTKRSALTATTATTLTLAALVLATAGCSTAGDSDAPSGTVRLLASGNPADPLDIGSTTGFSTSAAAQQVWDNLVSMTSDGAELVLAKDVEPSNSGKEWRITLRDTTFHDGNTVTAQDALDSLKYIAASPNFADAYTDVDFAASHTDGPKDVILELKRPRADLVEGVLSQASPVMPGGDPSSKIGTGPFRYVSGDSQSGFVLERNDSYINGAPAIEKLEIQNVSDPEARRRAIESGDAQYAEDVATGADLKNAEHVDIGMGGATAYGLELNTRVAPFNDPDVREAAKMTIDREQLVNLALGDNGQVGNDLVGKDLSGYDDSIAQRTPDLDKARKIFKEKGITELTLHNSEIFAGMTAASELLVQQFKDVGVDLKIETVSPESYYNDISALKKEPFFVSYYLNRPVSSTLPFQTEATSEWNLNGFTTPEYESILQKAMTTMQDDERADEYRKAQRILHADGGTIIWGYSKRLDAVTPGLSDVNFVQGQPAFGNAHLK